MFLHHHHFRDYPWQKFSLIFFPTTNKGCKGQKVELKKQSTCSVQLVNKSKDFVAFKVKNTSPKRYCVHPNTGIILPRSTCDFIAKTKECELWRYNDNTKCKLLHWSVDGVIAEGRIASADPKAKVHHVLLDGSCWKVWVDRVFVEKVDLIRPNEEIFFLKDAI